MVRKSVSTDNGNKIWVITLANLGNLSLNNVTYAYKTTSSGLYSPDISIGSLAAGNNNIGDSQDITITTSTSVSTINVKVTWTNSKGESGTKT
jgi:hypothetical protein